MLRACLVEMHTVMAGAPAVQLQAVRKKYTQPKLNSVAAIALPAL